MGLLPLSHLEMTWGARTRRDVAVASLRRGEEAGGSWEPGQGTKNIPVVEKSRSTSYEHVNLYFGRKKRWFEGEGKSYLKRRVGVWKWSELEFRDNTPLWGVSKICPCKAEPPTNLWQRASEAFLAVEPNDSVLWFPCSERPGLLSQLCCVLSLGNSPAAKYYLHLWILIFLMYEIWTAVPKLFEGFNVAMCVKH